MLKKYKIGGFSMLHGIWMLVLSVLINTSSISHWDDQEVASFFHFLKHNVIGIEESFNEQEFLFIDVSKSNELVKAYNEAGFEVGNQDITNRKSLAELFAIINEQNLHRQILCDILFELNSPNDSILKTEIEQTQRLLVSSYHAGDSLLKPRFNVPYSASDYEDQGSFFKYEMYHKSHKSTALTLLDENNDIEPPNAFDLVKREDGWWFNKFVVDFRIRPFHYTANKAISEVSENSEIHRINIVDLEPFLGLCRTMNMVGNKEFFVEMMEKKLIVLGDFSDRDIHSTITGDLAGPLILINAYLSLKAGENKVHIVMILFLLLSFSTVSYIIFKEGDVLELVIQRLFPNSVFMHKLFEFISFFFIIIITSFVTYLIWGFQLTVIWLVAYVKLVDWIKSLISVKERSNENTNS